MTGQCAFLTMDDTDGWSIDADLAIRPLARRGWTVEMVPWRRDRDDWSRFDAVYIGTPWDYPEDPDRFIAVLEAIECAGAVLVNPLGLVRWNLSKTYLRDLEQRGAAIVSSRWYLSMTEATLGQLLVHATSERIIVKPVVSTNANDTFLLSSDVDTETRSLLRRTFANRAFMVQPFIGGIVTEGEYSLFYLGGRFSHAVRKTPAAADFRVQEEYGADIAAIDAEPRLVDTADRVLELVRPSPVYARCDFVRDQEGRLLLMELEVIEPSLYLRMDPAAPARFADAFDRYVSAVRDAAADS